MHHRYYVEKQKSDNHKLTENIEYQSPTFDEETKVALNLTILMLILASCHTDI